MLIQIISRLIRHAYSELKPKKNRGGVRREEPRRVARPRAVNRRIVVTQRISLPSKALIKLSETFEFTRSIDHVAPLR